MSFDKETKDGVTVIRVNHERLDSNLAPDLKAELLMLVDQDTTNILVDLTKVIYVDSSGLGALLFGLRQLRDSKGTLKILRANERVANLIRIAQLEDILINFIDEEEALQSFKL